MAGKKKNMQGGIVGLNPSYENKSINDIANKIISGKKNENKMEGFKQLNSNYLRAEQRINAFFQKLNLELQKNPDDARSKKLFDWYRQIIEKYPDKIQEIRQREEDTFAFVDNFFKEKIPNKPTANNDDKVNQYINSTGNLINKFKLLNEELFPNKTGKTGIIELNNNQKEEMSNRIVKLAEEIYKKAIILKAGPDFTSLKKSLVSLYNLYRAIFIDNFIENGQNLKNVQGVANNKKNIAVKLKEKTNELKKINNNEQKKPREPMYISYPVRQDKK